MKDPAKIQRYLAWAFTLAVLVFVSVKLAQQWPAVRDALANARPIWTALATSCAMVLLTYGMLIETWRIVLVGWGHHLPYWEAARIWTISNLGKYIPGKVWALSAMAVMSEARGVSPVVAAAASLLIAAINTVVGFVVVAATGARVLDFPPAAIAAIALAGAAVVLVPAAIPKLGEVAGRLLGREVKIPPLAYSAVVAAAFATAAAWVGYGIAFRLFVAGVLGVAPGSIPLYTAVFAGSYLAGFLALFAPGGVGVREAVMAAGLQRAGFPTGPAYLVVVASRLWLTVLEVVPAVLFLGHGWMRARGQVKALFLTHAYPREAGDPVGSFVLRLAVLLRNEGIDVRVLAPHAPGYPVSAELEGIRVERFRYAPSRFETLAYTGTMMQQVKQSPMAKAALAGMVAAGTAAAAHVARRDAVDIVHAHWWFPMGFCGAIAWGARMHPQVTTLHGSDITAAHTNANALSGFRFVMRHSRIVTAVSRWLAEEANALVPEVRPEVAPMPVDPTLFYPASDERARDRLLFVGKLNEQKGIAPLLRALSLMQHRPELDVVVGPGSDEGPMRKLASDLGLGGQVRWHAMMAQSKLAELYREVTALVAPMIGEGLGLVAIEAALSGLPVVAANSGGLRDAVVDGVTGLMVPPADPAALSLALDALLSRPDQGASLGGLGRERALSIFSPPAVARRYADLYRLAVLPGA